MIPLKMTLQARIRFRLSFQSRPCVRLALVLLALLVPLLSACGSINGDGRRTANIDKSYKARDACLARNAAADDISNSDPATLARAVAQACSPETEQLVAKTNRDGDAKVADAIRKDSEFRAMGYVLKARGQLIF
jgi:hypothetical protein